MTDEAREKAALTEQLLRDALSETERLLGEARREGTAPAVLSRGPWLVLNVKSNVYWAANQCGYRSNVAEAGRYTLAEAIKCCGVRSRLPNGKCEEVIVPSPELLAYAESGE